MKGKYSQFIQAAFFFMLCSILSIKVNAIEQIAGYKYELSEAFSVHHNDAASADILVVNSNAQITTLNFDQFGVFNKPMLINISHDSNIDTLVINANGIHIKNTVSVIGKPVDLVFLSQDNLIACEQCAFDNVGRVTFVNGTFVNGVINTKNDGKVLITNLNASGLQSLEIMADNIITTGVIDLNLRAERHPNKGFIQSDNGSYVIGAGGINLYSGRFSIRYSNLDMISSTNSNATYVPRGTFKAASIGIVSSKSVSIHSSTEFNTMSDALSTSTRQGEFYAPTEGIFIQIAEDEDATLDVYGKLYSDRIITTKTIGPATFHAGSRLIGQTVKSFSGKEVLNQGYVDADSIEVAANRFINTGTLNGSKINIETQGDVYNTFGGVIKAGTLNVDLANGIFINGSRNNKLNWPSSKQLIAPSVNINDLNHGPYSGYSTSGTTQSRLSAKIHANTIKIVAKAIENINPYHIDKPSGVDWSDGIRINTVQAEQVSLAAESKIELKASEYIRNTSAILRLNQQGLFHIDTPLLFNERYRLETTAYLISRYVFTSGQEGSRDTVEQGVGTSVSAYSPPGRIVSFGDLQIGSKSEPANRRRFVNAFSYVELFRNARFQKLDLESIGIILSEETNTQSIESFKYCTAHQGCGTQFMDTSVEGETLLSIHGNVYGINPSIASQSDLIQDNSDSLEQQIRTAAEEHFSQYVFYTDEYNYGGYHSLELINETTVQAMIYECNGIRYEDHGLVPTADCTYSQQTVPLSQIIEDPDFSNTGFTSTEIRDAAIAYARARQYVTTSEDSRCDPSALVTQYDCTAQNFEFIDLVIDEQTQEITISYKYEILIEKSCDQCSDKLFTRYYTKSLTISVTTLMAN
ncbi:hypothetical protein [Pseudoalteromonas umbrosa]|uniref:hypothetical protein n=1 Tax=Pseudoalteromonas umbrosa TaxID=3048489 RepID=UPI0024C3858B|nr:hypothetical protein [Pseudoalteromonas sp. B95]MDK1286653.1 hypothetical protein [Pseudoalteromonas sp. B95]